ncbi:MAG TPA: sulfatase [Opitutaceae bacterium]|nr:sulfatase [Opitutaceae bacterium]
MVLSLRCGFAGRARRGLGVLFVLLLVLGRCPEAVRAAPASRPNVILILADDLGWSDLHCYGNADHDTPNLDRLATQGMRFTEGYASAPICSASRASIITGRSPARLGFEFVVKKPGTPFPKGHPLNPPPYPVRLPLSEVTLGEAVRPAGYVTGFYGKWHLAQHYQFYLGWSPTHGPLQQGYEEGNMEFGSHPYGDRFRKPSEMGPLPPGDYGDDKLTDLAVDFLRRHRQDRFFLQLCHYYVHEPIRSRAQWLVEKYAERLPPGTPRIRAVYAAMVETLDHLVGQLLHAVDQLGLAENTVIIFTSDNGGNPKYAANGPLRGGKWSLYEGGIRVPWIVRWPGHVPAGTTSRAPIIGSDLMPTLCAITGAPAPAHIALDGINDLPIWLGETKGDFGRVLTWHFPYYHPEIGYEKAFARVGINDFHLSQTHPQSAIRRGDWVLLHFYDSPHDKLYRLTGDLSEQRDESTKHPAEAHDLRRRLDAELRHMHARYPTPVASTPASVAPADGAASHP